MGHGAKEDGVHLSSVILIVAFSKAFELGLVVGLSHGKLTHPLHGDNGYLSFRDNGSSLAFPVYIIHGNPEQQGAKQNLLPEWGNLPSEVLLYLASLCGENHELDMH